MLIISDMFQGIKFPWRLVRLQEHWQLPYFLEALPYTREEAQGLLTSSGVVAEALRSGIRILPRKHGPRSSGKKVAKSVTSRARQTKTHSGLS